MNLVSKYLIVACGIAFISMGCQPKEFITLVAPAGETLVCSIDGESVGDVTDEGLKVKVEPESHTASWNLNGTLISVPVDLPLADYLLDALLTMGPYDNVNIREYTASTLGSAPQLLYYGDKFKRESTQRLSCAQVSVTVECNAGMPETFLAEVTVQIFSECQEEGEGEGEGMFFEDKNCAQGALYNSKPNASAEILINHILKSIGDIRRTLHL